MNHRVQMTSFTNGVTFKGHAYCSCGWVGEEHDRATKMTADAREHMKSHMHPGLHGNRPPGDDHA